MSRTRFARDEDDEREQRQRNRGGGEELDTEIVKPSKSFTEVIANKSRFLSPGCKRVIVIGPSGSGKTGFCTRALFNMFHPPIGGVYLVYKADSPANMDMYHSIEDYCEENDFPFVMDKAITKDMFKNIMADDIPKLLIVDDFIDGSYDPFTNHAIQSIFSRGRHKNCYMVLISQDYQSLPKHGKESFNIMLMWPQSRRGLLNYVIQCLDGTVDRDTLREVMQHIALPENKHSFAFLQKDGDSYIVNKDYRFFKI